MANLLGQNIGTNYKGILNLNTLNGNLSGTLQAVTDGDGNTSPLTLSTGEVGISRTIALSAGSSNVRLINETYTINNSGAQTGTATGIFLNATETALNGMGHNLIDLQVGGISQFRVGRTGNANFADSVIASNFGFTGIGVYSNGNGTRLSSPATNVFLISNIAGNDFNRLQFGGTTNAFPAIKRNGAAIDFRLADDSGYSNITLGRVLSFGTGASTIRWSTNLDVNQYSFGLTWYNSSSNAVIEFSQNGDTIQLGSGLFGSINSTPAASAIIEGRSTTKGFLPPRMTEAQRDLIASPATGLMIYNTTTNVLNFYNGSAWGAV